MLLGDATAALTCRLGSVCLGIEIFHKNELLLALGGLTQIFTADASHARLLMVSWK